MPGFGFGLSQSAMLSRIAITLPRDFDFGPMDEAMHSLVEERHALERVPADAARALVDRAAFWQAAIQRQQRVPVFGPHYARQVSRAPQSPAVFDVGVASYSPEATSVAVDWVLAAVSALMQSPAPSASEIASVRDSFEIALKDLQKFALPGVNNFHLVKAADASGIPWRPLVRDVFCFGMGARMRRFNSTFTERTPALATNLSRSKRSTASVLRQFGVPVPEHVVAASAQAAVEVAQRLGFPVVVKPDDQEQGRGVSAGLMDAAAVTQAFEEASKVSRVVLVERHHHGHDYRLTVLRDRVVKILRRRAGGVDGDGVKTIAQLLTELQGSPRLLRVRRQTGRNPLELDGEAHAMLREQGLDGASVPAAGRFVALRRKSNISAGGTQTLIPVEAAHPDNLALAVRATRALQLDICGVDLILPDVERSWLETGAVVIELNAQPQIGAINAPEVYSQILLDSVPPDGRIPVHLLVYGDAADSPTSDESIAFMRSHGCNALAGPHGVWTDGVQAAGPLATTYDAAKSLMLDSSVHAAACVMSAADVLAFGLPCDRITSLSHRGESDTLRLAMDMATPHLSVRPARETKNLS